jgi:hypothetical protein
MSIRLMVLFFLFYLAIQFSSLTCWLKDRYLLSLFYVQTFSISFSSLSKKKKKNSTTFFFVIWSIKLCVDESNSMLLPRLFQQIRFDEKPHEKSFNSNSKEELFFWCFPSTLRDGPLNVFIQFIYAQNWITARERMMADSIWMIFLQLPLIRNFI